MLLQELVRQLEHVALCACGSGWGGEAGRLAGSGEGRWPRYLPVGAAWHGGAGDGVEEGQAVPVLHRLRYLLSDSGLDGALFGRRVRRDEDETRAVELVHGDGAEGHVGGAHLLPHLVRVMGWG